MFTPEDVKENDRRLCGYNFMSYVTYDALMSRFGGTTVSDFDIEWEPSAYAKNKAGKYDYSLVEKSTEAPIGNRLDLTPAATCGLTLTSQSFGTLLNGVDEPARPISPPLPRRAGRRPRAAFSWTDKPQRPAGKRSGGGGGGKQQRLTSMLRGGQSARGGRLS